MNKYIFIFLISFSQVSFAWTTYQTDQFHIHKLCVKDPWNAYNATPAYHSDVTTYPCQYDYAIVHVPTLEKEVGLQLSITNPVITLDVPKPHIDSMIFLMGFYFASTLTFLFSVWGFGILLKLVSGKYPL